MNAKCGSGGATNADHDVDGQSDDEALKPNPKTRFILCFSQGDTVPRRCVFSSSGTHILSYLQVGKQAMGIGK